MGTAAKISLALLLLLVLSVGLYHRRIIRVYKVLMLFKPDVIASNFRSMDTILATSPVRRGTHTHRFAQNLQDLPKTYEFQESTKNLDSFLDETWTTGLVVLKDGVIVFEKYYRDNTETSKVISWSVAKSIISALVGIAVQENAIESIDEPVTDYVPSLSRSGYNNVRIKDVLQMSSGVRFDEDYGDFFSDVNRMGRVIALDGSIDDFVASLIREWKPGTYHHYISPDTQVLGMLLAEATGQTVASLLEEKIWKKMGMESDAYWLVDGNGRELVFGGLNAVLRDYARFGQLYLNQGSWEGDQIVPGKWVQASITPDAPHLQPGNNPASSSIMGYGFQWWLPPEPEGDFLAIGVYNQFIYVHPIHGVVIAKSSAFPYYNEGDQKELETIAVFRAIANALSTNSFVDPDGQTIQ